MCGLIALENVQVTVCVLILLAHFLLVLIDEVLRTDAHDAFEGATEVRDIVGTHLTGYVLDGVVASDEEELGAEDAPADDVVDGCEARLLTEETDEGVFVQAGLGREFVERGDLRQVTVDGPHGFADADVVDGSLGCILVHELRQEHMKESVDAHLVWCRQLLEGFDTLHVLVGGVIADGRDVLQQEVGHQAADVHHDVFQYMGGGDLQDVAVVVEVVVDVHGEVGEHDIAVGGRTIEPQTVGEEGRNEVEPVGTQFVPLIATEQHTAAFRHQNDA